MFTLDYIKGLIFSLAQELWKSMYVYVLYFTWTELGTKYSGFPSKMRKYFIGIRSLLLFENCNSCFLNVCFLFIIL